MLPVFAGKVYLIKDVSDNAVFYKDEKLEDQRNKSTWQISLSGCDTPICLQCILQLTETLSTTRS